LNLKEIPGDSYIYFPGRIKELQEESVYNAESLYTPEKAPHLFERINMISTIF